jgi:oligosaccharide repeat unit polymerase
MAGILFAIHLAMVGRRLSAMDPLIWVPVFMLLFYFGIPVAVDLMGFDPGRRAVSDIRELDVSYAMNLMALTAFFFGVHIAGIGDASQPTAEFRQGKHSLVLPSLSVGALGYAMVLIGIVIAGPSLLFGHYADLKIAETFGEATTSWLNVGLFIVPAASMALLSSYEPGDKWIPRFLTIAMAPILVLLIMIGDRGGLAVQTMGLGWVYTQRFRRLPFKVVAVGVLFAFILMPIIKEWRNYRNLQETAQLSLYELVGATFYEAGSSGLVFSWTVDAVPRTRPYDYGITIGVPFVRLFPWVSRTPLAFDELAQSHNPNFWISEHIDPASYDVKGAHHGFTMTGTWYASFGIPGIFVLGTFIGWLSGKMRNIGRGTPMMLTASGLSVVFMLLFVRNSLTNPLRFTFWPLALIVIAYFLFGLVGTRRRVLVNEDASSTVI